MATKRTVNALKSTPMKPRRAAPERDVGVNVLIPASLHRRLRLRTVKEGTTLSEAVTEAVREWMR